MEYSMKKIGRGTLLPDAGTEKGPVDVIQKNS